MMPKELHPGWEGSAQKAEPQGDDILKLFDRLDMNDHYDDDDKSEEEKVHEESFDDGDGDYGLKLETDDEDEN